MAESAEILCSNSACKVRQDGRCVEGLPLDKCTHYGKPLVVEQSVKAAANGKSGIVLPSGDFLDPEEASSILRRGSSRVIAVVAPKEAGKTTLISSVFELFLRGPVGPLRFCGSQSMYAFERACHPSRGVSKNAVPQTERTILTEVRFYHTAMRRPDLPRIDLLVADRGGEDYRAAADDASTAQGFVEVTRADTITFLVDGRQLADPVTRISVGSEILAIAQALADGGAIQGRPRVALVLTKLDDVFRSQDRERVERDFERFDEKFRQMHGGSFGEIRSFRVAACPSDDTLPLGHGVDALLAYWEEAAPIELVEPAPFVPSPTRYMHRLQGSSE
ncbi:MULTISPECIES: hypothetical protein [unclassified Bradyrhizobium]|uniref:TRAFAC clade GTPase domain-containing protein n=1 Tax=unclassified Bradyrhizobium TaxID=2631580 RepID=UPI001FF9CDA7|nr:MULTISPECIES: hypothetical protein [unclassified Bradyrhizobium]MCK1538243.1 hypothetical protein [Bradyrhizobium sp. 176]MCK1560298.1 hypothetical protein [Bradyrhizobium sp. 171]